MSNIQPLLPRLTVNGRFIDELLSVQAPCFGLGLVEERQQASGLLALRPDVAIPQDVTNLGFRLGHSLLGNEDFEVVHFAFHFYGFGTYNALVNPNNPAAKTVLTTMVETEDYFFFAISPNEGVTAFRSEIGEENLVGLKTNLRRIRESRTTDAQYRKAVSLFGRNPQPPGKLLNWVCREDAGYLDLAKDRLELNPV